MSRAKRVCLDLCHSPQAWNVTTTLLTAFFLIVGTILLVQNCYVPDNGTLSSECASQASILFASKYAVAYVIASIALSIIVLYQILVAAGITCDGMCNNSRHTIVLALVSAISAAVYADFVHDTLQKVPTSPIGNPEACYVCPNGRDDANLGVLFTAVVFAFLGFVSTIIVSCMDHEDTQTSGHVQLVTEDLQPVSMSK